MPTDLEVGGGVPMKSKALIAGTVSAGVNT